MEHNHAKPQDCGEDQYKEKCDCNCKCSCHHEQEDGEKLPRLSLKDIAPRLPSHMVDEYKQEQLLMLHPSKTCGPHVVEFSPWSAFPGSLVVIIGHGFAPRRGLNTVSIGGREALVVTAERHRLVVISDFKTRDGPVCVSTRCGKSTGLRDFKVLSWPAPYPALETDGPPHSFKGAGNATWTELRPKLSSNQHRLQAIPVSGIRALSVPRSGTAKVLTVCCYPSDLAPANTATAKANIVKNCAAMTKYYSQASYGKLNVAVDVTDFFAMIDNLAWYYRASSTTDPGYPNFKAEVMPQIYAESANYAKGQGYNLDNYDILMTIVHMGTFVRAWGGGSIGPSIKYFRTATTTQPAVSINVEITGTLGTITLGDDADWGRYAHEFGHNIVPPPGVLRQDIYASDTTTGADFTAQEFDLMGDHDSHPLFSGYNIEGLGWFDSQNVLALTWSRTPFSREVEIVAHGLTQNTNSSRVHLIRIQVSSGLEYYIEVRQKPGTTGQVFDSSIPVPAGKDGGVLVTRSITGTVNNNEEIRLTTLLQASQTTLTAGQVAVDPLRTILITVVDDNIQATPRICKVKIEWAQPATGTPGGTFDLWLEPWGPSYTTPDIWIDRNPFGVYDRQDASGAPINGGDAPRLGEINKLNARIRNTGTSDANNVVTSFYVNSPPGIGDSGNWTPLKTVTIQTTTAGSNYVAEAEWDPLLGEHTCLKVAIVPQTGEVSISNNRAQENVFTFQPASHSVPEPVELPVTVRNPLDRRTLVWLSIDGVPEGYYVYFPRQYLYLEPHGERNLELLVIPLCKVRDLKFKVANVRVSGYLPWQYVDKMPSNGLPPASVARHIGGIQAIVAPKVGSQIRLQDNPDSNTRNVIVNGNVTPATNAQAVRVDMIWEFGQVDTQSVMTDKDGSFTATFSLFKRGGTSIAATSTAGCTVNLAFQAHIINAAVLAPNDSNIVHYIARLGPDDPEVPR